MSSIRTLAFAALTAVALSPAAMADCRPQLRQTVTFHEGFFCSYFTYCYELVLPADCVIPITRFCVQFIDVGELDADSIQSPDGWTGAVNPATNEICWSITRRSAALQPGASLGGFCVDTECNPRTVEGKQPWSAWGAAGVVIVSGGSTAVARVSANLGGDRQAALGQNARFAGSCAHMPQGRMAVLVGIARLPQPLPTPFGLLHLDPVLMSPVSMMSLNGNGVGQSGVNIPLNPLLHGALLPLQAVAIATDNGLVLSNPWQLQVQ
jgi:hypothetical protein